MKTLLFNFCLIVFLLSPTRDARADRLFQTNLLKQNSEYQPNSKLYSQKAIDAAQAQMRKEPNLAPNYQLEIASMKAHQGRLTEALNDLSEIKADFRMSDFYEERAEIKSLLGLDDSAIQDMDRILQNNSGLWQSWQTNWHKAVILDRAGKHSDANLCLQQAMTNLLRFNTDNIFTKTFLKIAKERDITAIAPSPKKQEIAVTLMQTLLNKSSAPDLKETLKLLGLDSETMQRSESHKDRYFPLSADSPFRLATITPDGHQIRLYLDSTTCMLTPETVRKIFDAATEQELWPGNMSGCGPATLTLYRRDNGMFVFDGARTPGLSMFFISYKQKPNQKTD